MLSPDFFIVMDRLYGTLCDRIGEWSQLRAASRGIMGFGAKKNDLKQLLVERMVVAYDLAAAFWHLHDHR
jgi:hypothetical protein